MTQTTLLTDPKSLDDTALSSNAVTTNTYEKFGHYFTAERIQPCNCIGPQNGEPKCPCMMRDIIVRDGRYIQKEIDLGPVR